jgi:hypothetical protein
MKRVFIVTSTAERCDAINAITEIAAPYNFSVTIDDSPKKEKRSEAQNRLMWKWNGELQAYMREYHGITATADDWHEVMCNRLRPPTIKGYHMGQPVLERWRTSKAGVNELKQYLDEYCAYCANDLGLVLPIPDDLRMAVYGHKVNV